MLSIHLVSIMMWILLYRLATALGMRPKHEYWYKCTWQTNGINKTATCDRLDHCWHRTGIELVFKSLDCFTIRLFHNATIFLLQHMYMLSETFFYFVCVCEGWGVGWGDYLDLVGEHAVPMYLLFGAVYWSLGRRWYLGVSNVALVFLF